jgi:dTDP-4-dehydrorhamnose reductase
MLILGSTGMLGQSLIKTAKESNIEVTGIARSNADINLDILNFDKLISLIRKIKPKTIVNCVAISSIDLCEANVEESYLHNAHLVAVLVDVCLELDIYLIHISTDHFFINDGRRKHDEKSPVVLVNNYAKTKYAGEQFALSYSKSLVIRTNIVGFRNTQSHTFVEWVLLSLKNKNEITLFQDFYTSSIDVYSFSKILLKINNRDKPIYGLVNIASSEVCSKEEFIKKLAHTFNYNNPKFNLGSIESIEGTKRAESIGLDVSKIEKLLDEKMPTTNDVVLSLCKNWIN